MRWTPSTPAPFVDLNRSWGSATAQGSEVYVRKIQEMYAYSSQTEIWTNLPDCPHTDCSLAVVNGLLTAVGGIDSQALTSMLMSLIGEGDKRKWSEHFPPMPTERKYPAVVCSGRSLVVAGGMWSAGSPDYSRGHGHRRTPVVHCQQFAPPILQPISNHLRGQPVSAGWL